MLFKASIIVLIITIGGTQVIQQQPDVHAMISELSQSQFGQTILETITIQLATPEPVQNLINILQDLNTRLEGEQERDDRLHERFQSNCENDIGELEAVINECTSSSKLLKGQLDQLQPDKQAKVSDLSRKKDELVDLQNELQYQQEKREKEKQRYDTTLDNLEQGLFAINQAKKMFNDFLNVLIKNQQRFASSQSFLEEGDPTLGDIVQQLNKLKHNIKAEGFHFLVHGISHLTNLLQVDSPEEQELMSRKVIEVIDQVDNWIQKQRITEDMSEQQRRDAFLALQQMYDDQIVFAQEIITSLEGQIESLNSQITAADNEKQEVDQKQSVKETQLGDREVDCKNEELDYNKEQNKRDKERESLNVALDLVINKLGQLKKEVLQK